MARRWRWPEIDIDQCGRAPHARIATGRSRVHASGRAAPPDTGWRAAHTARARDALQSSAVTADGALNMHRMLPAILALSLLLPVAAATPAGDAQLCAPTSAADAMRVVETELSGVPARLRVPARVSAPPIVLWHGFGPPDGEAALEALLPLDEVPAVKVYLGLPLFGKRAPDDPSALARRQQENLATGVFEPVVMGAARELAGVVEALRRHGCLQAGQGIGLFGFSAGGATTLYALAEREVPVEAAVVLNASTGLSASVAAYERATGNAFAWTPETRAIARQSDAVARAADIARGTPPPALVIVHGADDAMVDGEGPRALHQALADHYADAFAARLALEIVDALPHAIRTPEDIARVRGLVGAWFLRFMPGARAGVG
jgi:dienelactone hydrolase